MKICHFDFSEPLSLSENFAMLVVENATKLYEYCNDFFIQQRGEDGKFIIAEGEKEISFKKYGLIVFDVFNLSLQDKKITNGLFSLLQRLVDEKFTAEQWAIRCKILALMEMLGLECDYPVEYNEDFLFTEMFKAMKLQLKEDYSGILEKVVAFIDAICAFTDVKLLIFVGISAFLNKEDFDKLAEHIAYSSVNVLLIEKNQLSYSINKKMLIIDDDLCEIVVN